MIGEIKKLNNKSKVVLKITIKKDKDIFIAYCPALDLVDYGKTVRMAEKNLKIVSCFRLFFFIFFPTTIPQNIFQNIPLYTRL